VCDRGEKKGHQSICERDDLIEKKKKRRKKKKTHMANEQCSLFLEKYCSTKLF
jgi:hypothetical protein